MILRATKNLLKYNRDYITRKIEIKKNRNYRFPEPEVILDQKYIFVLSTGRCGTGLITKILSGSSLIYCEHNPKPELEYVSSLVHQLKPNLDALKISVLAARLDTYFLEAFMRGKVFAETNNRISFFAPALAELLPNAKFIHLVRNPADFVRSGMRRNYYKDGVVQHQRLRNPCSQEWINYTRLEKIAWEWDQINKNIEVFKNNYGKNKTITVLSEDLFSKIETTNEIFQFIGITNPYNTTKTTKKLKEILSSKENEQISGDFPRYQDWIPNDQERLWEIAKTAILYGYNK